MRNNGVRARRATGIVSDPSRPRTLMHLLNRLFAAPSRRAPLIPLEFICSESLLLFPNELPHTARAKSIVHCRSRPHLQSHLMQRHRRPGGEHVGLKPTFKVLMCSVHGGEGSAFRSATFYFYTRSAFWPFSALSKCVLLFFKEQLPTNVLTEGLKQGRRRWRSCKDRIIASNMNWRKSTLNLYMTKKNILSFFFLIYFCNDIFLCSVCARQKKNISSLQPIVAYISKKVSVCDP